MRSIPIIIVHQGNQSYLRTCLNQAKQKCPLNPIYLLGDNSNQLFAKNHINIQLKESNINKDIDLFRELYRHSSNQNYHFERFCIERWFFIRNLMEHLRMDKCCAIDSDVLVFRSVDDAREELKGYAMSFGRWDSTKLFPHFNIIQEKQALDSFCEYVLELFSNPASYARFTASIVNRKGRSWVCDMSLFWDWNQSQDQFKIAIFEDLGEKFYSFDSSISKLNNFKASPYHYFVTKRWKELTFRDGQAIATRKGKEISMRYIHYHGKFKVLMDRHSTRTSDSLKCFLLLVGEKIKHIPTKIKLLTKNHLSIRRRG